MILYDTADMAYSSMTSIQRRVLIEWENDGLLMGHHARA